MNKKGFTVVELMTTFVLISMIALLLIRLTITLKEIYINGDLKTVLLTKQGTMTDKIYKDLNENKLTAINSCENNVVNCIELVYDTGSKIFKIDKNKKTITYDNYTIKLVKGSSFGNITIDKYNNDSGNILTLKVPINNKLVKGDYGLNIVHQIDNNVTIDSNIKFDVKNTGILVTFDPNGGTVDTSTKYVTLNEKYGSLPIPKRKGYTFKGWNGKNLFDKSKAVDDKVLTWAEGQLYNEEGSVASDFIAVKYGSTYVSKYYMQVILYDANKNYIGKYNNVSSGFRSFTISNNQIHYVRIGFRGSSDNPDMTLVEDLQLEEGETATEYEPYYVKYNTKVTQNENHTLKAIWEKDTNKNIVKAYNYDETNNATKCINGEENTCVETNCYETKTANSCKQGTIIKYKVNDNEEKYFYVLHDDGKKMTLQQRENTVRNVAWHAGENDNTKGPDTILAALESATSGWTNVNKLNYTLGVTNLYENKYTGCIADSNEKLSCSSNKYTMNERTTRARIITGQEVSSTECILNTHGSCPNWMYNYMFQSSNFDGNFDDNTTNENGKYNYGYWTTSANLDNSTNIWYVARTGNLYGTNTSDTNIAVRAVVEINK